MITLGGNEVEIRALLSRVDTLATELDGQKALAPTLKQLADAGQNLPMALKILPTYPLPDAAIGLPGSTGIGTPGGVPFNNGTPSPPLPLPQSAPPPAAKPGPQQGGLIGGLLGTLLGGGR